MPASEWPAARRRPPPGQRQPERPRRRVHPGSLADAVRRRSGRACASSSCDAAGRAPRLRSPAGSGGTSPSPREARSELMMARPTVLSANPVRMIVAERRLPALRPARIATANMVSESGAMDRPVCNASYSSLISTKIGSAIIAPPSVTLCQHLPGIPILKCGGRERIRIEQGHLLALHGAARASGRGPTARAPRSRSAARRNRRPPATRHATPSTTPPIPTTDRPAPTPSTCRSPVYGTSFNSFTCRARPR